jgi:hypothetical protein
VNESEALVQLTHAFVQMGADEKAARVMATQLWKRAQQVALEKTLPLESALAELLEKVVAGRRGNYRPQS